MAISLASSVPHSMRVAQERGIPYVSLSSGVFEIGPEVARHIHAPDRSATVLASHWLAAKHLRDSSNVGFVLGRRQAVISEIAKPIAAIKIASRRYEQG